MKQAQFQRSSVLRFRRLTGKGYGAFRSLGRVVNIGVVAGLTLSMAYTSMAQAQNASPQLIQEQEQEEQELDPVMVSASKLATPIAQTAKNVTVISHRELSQKPAHSLADLLVYVAGVDVAQRGGHGVQADISIRGGSFDQNAILLNGINLSNAQTGHLSYDVPINLSDIERIEIIHGPSALIYGAGAFTGGINIITKKEATDRVYLRLTGGAHELTDLEGRIALSTQSLSHSLSVGRQASAGYIDNTDYKILNLLWQTRADLGADNKLDLQLGYNGKEFGANAFYSPKGPKQFEATSSLLGSVKGELGTEKLRIVPIVYWKRGYDEYHWVRGTLLNQARTDNVGASLALTYVSSLGSTSVGVEYRREDILSNKLGNPIEMRQGKYNRYATRTNLSASLEHSLTVGMASLSAGMLVNHNTQRQGKLELYPAISATLRPATGLSLSASWSKSVRIPTFTDLFYTGPVQRASQDLRSERSEAVELSARYSHGVVGLYATAYKQWGRDIIDWAKLDATDQYYRSINIFKLDTYGFELGAMLRLGRLLPVLGEESILKVDYARTQQSSPSEGIISLYAMRSLRDKLTAHLSHRIVGGLSATWQLRWQKRMGVYEAGQDATTQAKLYASYPSVATIDLKLNYKLHRDLDLHLSASNLTNRKYFDFAAVHQPGFWLSGGITYRLGR